MIKGLGIDTVFVDRIENAAQNPSFVKKCFSSAEIEIYKCKGKNAQFLAGNFAAKEAVAKALGTGFSGFWPRDVEVLRDTLGKPYVNLLGAAKETAVQMGATVIHVSITNTHTSASAVAILESRQTHEK